MGEKSLYKLIRVADNFTTLSDAEKEALFNNYEQASDEN